MLNDKSVLYVLDVELVKNVSQVSGLLKQVYFYPTIFFSCLKIVCGLSKNCRDIKVLHLYLLFSTFILLNICLAKQNWVHASIGKGVVWPYLEDIILIRF